MRIEIPAFPKTKQDPFFITSPQTAHYNCIAWALEDSTKWYWPDAFSMYFWPSEISREERIDSFIKLFESIGYQICDNHSLEPNFQKIAIYTNASGKPTHAARQLNNGFWTSKLGESFDVTHTISSMSDGFYGNAKVFMKRKTA